MMIRIDENTNYYLFCIYEHGEFYHSCRKLELKISDRQIAREVIRQFIELNLKQEDNKHPLLSMHPLQTRSLIELLQQSGKGNPVNLYPEPPSVF